MVLEWPGGGVGRTVSGKCRLALTILSVTALPLGMACLESTSAEEIPARRMAVTARLITSSMRVEPDAERNRRH